MELNRCRAFVLPYPVKKSRAMNPAKFEPSSVSPIADDFGGFAALLTVHGQLSVTVIAHWRAVSDPGIVVHLVIRHIVKARIAHGRRRFSLN